MRVAWSQIYAPGSPDDYEDWHPITLYFAGEVINSVRAFGETRVVVMCDDGEIRETPIENVRQEINICK